MAFIKLFDFKNSNGLLKKEYEKGLRRAGRIWNVLTIQSQTPEILRDSMRLYNSTMFGNSNVPRFERELLAVVTSISNECEY
jgi:alkylhydroperoxidase family enzyme